MMSIRKNKKLIKKIGFSLEKLEKCYRLLRFYMNYSHKQIIEVLLEKPEIFDFRTSIESILKKL